MKIKILGFLFLIFTTHSFSQSEDLTGLYLNGIKIDKEINCYNFDTLLIAVKLNVNLNQFESLEGGLYIISVDSASGKILDKFSPVQWLWDSTKNGKWDIVCLAAQMVNMKKTWVPQMACDNFRNGDTHLVAETGPSGDTRFMPVPTTFYHIKRYCELRVKVMSNNMKNTTTLCNIRYEMKNLYITKRIKHPKYPDELIIKEPKISEFEKCKISGERIKLTVDQIRALKN